jgi:predicted GIY-YIG superfamily endonuclease
MGHYCYILLNESCSNTYVGYTVNPVRRLRQHNGEICGGASMTKRISPGAWRFAAIFECPEFDNHLALSFEWHLKDHTKRRSKKIYERDVISRRVKQLAKALKHHNFCEKNITVYVLPELTEYFKSLPITIGQLDVFFTSVFVKDVIKSDIGKLGCDT